MRVFFLHERHVSNMNEVFLVVIINLCMLSEWLQRISKQEKKECTSVYLAKDTNKVKGREVSIHTVKIDICLCYKYLLHFPEHMPIILKIMPLILMLSCWASNSTHHYFDSKDVAFNFGLYSDSSLPMETGKHLNCAPFY